MYGSKNYEAVTHVRVKEKEKEVPMIDNLYSYLVVVSIDVIPKTLPILLKEFPRLEIEKQLIFIFQSGLPRNEHPWGIKHHTIVHWFTQTFPKSKEICVLTFETTGELFGFIIGKGAKGGTLIRSDIKVDLPFDSEKKKDYFLVLGF